MSCNEFGLKHFHFSMQSLTHNFFVEREKHVCHTISEPTFNLKHLSMIVGFKFIIHLFHDNQKFCLICFNTHI